MVKMIDVGNLDFLVGKSWICSVGGRDTTCEIEQSDIGKMFERTIGFGRDDTTAMVLVCPKCGGYVYWDEEARKIQHVQGTY